MIATTVRYLVIASLIAVTSNAQDREERVSRTFDITGSGELSLSNVSGDITVEGVSGTEVTVEAIKRVHGRARDGLLQEVRVDFSHTGDRLRIETRYPEHDDHDDDERRRSHRRGGGVSVDYRLKVPTGTELELVSVSGDLRVSSVDGETTVRSVSGDVNATGVPRLAEAKSVSGDVAVRGVRSDDVLEVASVSGDVTVEDAQVDELDVASVSGDVRLMDVAAADGEFDSVSGSVLYRGAIASGGRYEFKSHSGDITIEIGSDVGFELEAKTFSGRIESDFEMEVSERGRRGRKLTAVVGNGSAVIEATTFSGDIELRPR